MGIRVIPGDVEHLMLIQVDGKEIKVHADAMNNKCKFARPGNFLSIMCTYNSDCDLAKRQDWAGEEHICCFGLTEGQRWCTNLFKCKSICRRCILVGEKNVSDEDD